MVFVPIYLWVCITWATKRRADHLICGREESVDQSDAPSMHTLVHR